MTKQEILDKLATRDNFHEVVDIALQENLERNSRLSPDILIYTHTEKGEIRFTNLDIKSILVSFRVNGEIMQGVTNFFKHYKKITDFYDITHDPYHFHWKVVPNIVSGHDMWYKDFEARHYEISYDCHSLSGPAIIITESGKIYEKEYYADGQKISIKDWKKLVRKEKIKRVIDEKR